MIKGNRIYNDYIFYVFNFNLQATLKMDRRVSFLQRERIVHSLILELGLSNCVNSRLSNLSGGERRRVSLSVQVNNFIYDN